MVIPLKRHYWNQTVYRCVTTEDRNDLMYDLSPNVVYMQICSYDTMTQFYSTVKNAYNVVFMQICSYDTMTQFYSTVKNAYNITNDSKF